MKAVILAAGYGKRMGGDTPKPLVKLYGLPLIEHKIRRLKGYDIIVVYHDESVEKYLRKKFPDVKLVYNPYPERENGYSLYCVKNIINEGESFLLLMADHYYDEAFYSNVGKNKNTVVFVSERCYQEDEATKVKVEKEKVLKIGKSLNDYDYFDTGFFLCSYEVLIYAEKAVSMKKEVKLSDIMQLLADDRKLFYRVVNNFWIDIDTREDLKEAEFFIRKSLIKPTDGFISRYINRKISTRITPHILKYDFLTPNAVTIFVTFLGFLSSFLFLFKYSIAGGIMTQIVSIIDGCDGEIARVKNISSRYGAVLDSVLDRYVDIFILSGIYLSVEKSIILSISFILALAGSVLVSYISHLSGMRPYFATRDIRLFIIMIGGFFIYFNEHFVSVIFILIGFLTHLSVFYILQKIR